MPSTYKEVKRETAELAIPEPGLRIRYTGYVIRVDKFFHRAKPLKIKGKVRYGSVQLVLPKEAVNRPVYVIAYVLLDREYPEYEYKPLSRPGRTPLIKVV